MHDEKATQLAHRKGEALARRIAVEWEGATVKERKKLLDELRAVGSGNLIHALEAGDDRCADELERLRAGFGL